MNCVKCGALMFSGNTTHNPSPTVKLCDTCWSKLHGISAPRYIDTGKLIALAEQVREQKIG